VHASGVSCQWCWWCDGQVGRVARVRPSVGRSAGRQQVLTSSAIFGSRTRVLKDRARRTWDTALRRWALAAASSQHREELDATKTLAKSRLAAAEQRNAQLAADKAKLGERLEAQGQLLDLQHQALAQAIDKAVKQKQLAEELRRSDALLAKRLLHAQLRHLGGEAHADVTAGAVDGSTMAAAMALSAHDELQLCQVKQRAQNSLKHTLPLCPPSLAGLSCQPSFFCQRASW